MDSLKPPLGGAYSDAVLSTVASLLLGAKQRVVLEEIREEVLTGGD